MLSTPRSLVLDWATWGAALAEVTGAGFVQPKNPANENDMAAMKPFTSMTQKQQFLRRPGLFFEKRDVKAPKST
jgi:hypothetical protein